MARLHLFSILMLAVSSNLDNFGVGVAYGIRRVCISVSSNLLIAVINTTGTFVSMVAGERLYHYMQSDTANYAGSAIFIIAGCLVVINDIVKKERKSVYISGESFVSKMIPVPDKPWIINMYCKGRISLKEGFVLAAALTFSNLATGIGAGLIGLNLSLTILFVFSFSIAAIIIGMKAGQYSASRWLGASSNLVSGLLLIVIGVYEMVS